MENYFGEMKTQLWEQGVVSAWGIFAVGMGVYGAWGGCRSRGEKLFNGFHRSFHKKSSNIDPVEPHSDRENVDLFATKSF